MSLREGTAGSGVGRTERRDKSSSTFYLKLPHTEPWDRYQRSALLSYLDQKKTKTKTHKVLCDVEAGLTLPTVEGQPGTVAHPQRSPLASSWLVPLLALWLLLGKDHGDREGWMRVVQGCPARSGRWRACPSSAPHPFPPVEPTVTLYSAYWLRPSPYLTSQ